MTDVDTAALETELPTAEPPAAELYGCPTTEPGGQQVVFVPRDRYLDVVGQLRNEGFDLCSDVTAVDYLNVPDNERSLPIGVVPQRFEVVVNLTSLEQKRRMRLRVQLPADDAVIPTLYDLYRGTEAMEREVFDLMGVRFANHPDLTRILMPEDWEGHPLRKDYSQGRIPVQFKYTAGKYDASDRP